jgi:hypothetical protein
LDESKEEGKQQILFCTFAANKCPPMVSDERPIIRVEKKEEREEGGGYEARFVDISC